MLINLEELFRLYIRTRPYKNGWDKAWDCWHTSIHDLSKWDVQPIFIVCMDFAFGLCLILLSVLRVLYLERNSLLLVAHVGITVALG
jgi:hypothetical protein